MSHHPDPVVSASIYTQYGLEELVRGAIVPFRDELRRHAAGEWALWMIRYSRCGPHLKVRLHGPEEEAPLVRTLLAEAVERYFASLEGAEGLRRQGTSRPKAPAVDPEDERSEDYPDRTLLWTSYRRSAITFGPPSLLDDDRYAARMTAALAAGAEVVLDSLRPGMPSSDGARLRTLLGVLAAGVTAADFTAEERATFLEYHRGWLTRFVIADPRRETETLDLFERRAAAMESVLEEGRRAVRGWDEGTEEGGSAQARWRESVAALSALLAPHRGDPAYAFDPFSADPVFPPVFKTFHGVANQLGVDMLNEAFVHHLLLRAISGVPAEVPAGAALVGA